MNDIMYELIKANEGLIYKIASKYSKYYSIEDLYQVGSIGVIKAYKKYREDSNAKFSTYAYKYVLGEIVDFIRKDRNIIVSEEYMSIYKKYINIRELLFTKYEREPSFSEISRDDILNKILIDTELESMDEIDRKIIDYRYYQGYSQSETATLMGMSQAGVSRSEKLILSKIKDKIA